MTNRAKTKEARVLPGQKNTQPRRLTSGARVDPDSGDQEILALQARLSSTATLISSGARDRLEQTRCPSLLSRPTPFPFSSHLTLNSIVDLIQGRVFLKFLELRSVFLLPSIGFSRPFSALPLYAKPSFLIEWLFLTRPEQSIREQFQEDVFCVMLLHKRFSSSLVLLEYFCAIILWKIALYSSRT